MDKSELRSIADVIAGDLPLRIRVAADVLVQVVLVDVNDLDAMALDLDRHRLARLVGLGVVDGALPVAVVQLSRAYQREEARRIDLIDEFLADDLDIVAELF